MKEEIILYRLDKLATHLEVRVEGETVWLNCQQIALLFDRDVKTIGKHIVNVMQEELKDFSVVAKFATTATDGKTNEIYHIGASLKDLGKKWFAFSKLEKNSVSNILLTIKELIG